jgi:hypothetical protein
VPDTNPRGLQTPILPDTSNTPHQKAITMNTTLLTRTDSTTLERPRRRRGWAYAGLFGGIGSFLFFLGPANMLSPSQDSYSDNAKVLAELEGKAGWVWAFQTGGVALALLLVIFAVGLRRRLAGQEPAGSLVPDLSAIGLILMAVMTLVGTGISTEMFQNLRHSDKIDPDTVAAQLAIYNTLAWVWAGGLLTTGAMAVAGLRHGSVSRRFGRFAVVMSVVVVVTQVLPIQYLAVLPMSIFLIVCGVSMVRTESAS